MTPLRQRMTEDMQLRNLSAGTQRAYLHCITGLARWTEAARVTDPGRFRSWNRGLKLQSPDAQISGMTTSSWQRCHTVPALALGGCPIIFSLSPWRPNTA
jgi:hypothetical protein